MLSDLPELVRRLRRQGRKLALIDGLGREAYAPDDRSAAVDVALTPYVTETNAAVRNADIWLSGPEFAILEPLYAEPPTTRAPDRPKTLLASISGTDPWALTEAAADALSAGGLPPGWEAVLVAGPGFTRTRTRALKARTARMDGVCVLNAPPNLRDAFLNARLALLGPGLAKYEAAACGLFSLICSPEPVYADMNRPFALAGLGQVLPPGPPDARALRAAIEAAVAANPADPRSVIDGKGAARAAARLVSELFNESRDGEV